MTLIRIHNLLFDYPLSPLLGSSFPAIQAFQYPPTYSTTPSEYWISACNSRDYQMRSCRNTVWRKRSSGQCKKNTSSGLPLGPWLAFVMSLCISLASSPCGASHRHSVKFANTRHLHTDSTGGTDERSLLLRHVIRTAGERVPGVRVAAYTVWHDRGKRWIP